MLTYHFNNYTLSNLVALLAQANLLVLIILRIPIYVNKYKQGSIKILITKMVWQLLTEQTRQGLTWSIASFEIRYKWWQVAGSSTSYFYIPIYIEIIQQAMTK
jgi:hypothetical protein